MPPNGTGGLFADETALPPPSGIAAEPPGGPLATRMRPRSVEEMAGNARLLAPGAPLRQAIEQDRLGSMILWGPPGCGKSTLAHVIAATTQAAFENYSAVTSGVADIRRVIETARERRSKLGRRTILFIDEIHRWNRAQQDALLPHVENGTVVLIGATTENPYFEVNAPLLSRVRLLRLEPLADEDVRALLVRALADSERGLGGAGLSADDDALDHLVAVSGGDARHALTALEAAADAALHSGDPGHITRALAEEGAQQRALRYDRDRDEHYDTISAFIKSMRGSDPDASVYWLAAMLHGGEDIKFIARRMVILASEDIGAADPQSLVVANAAAQAVQFVGLPEAELILSQAAIHLACAPKSNACTVALGRAKREIDEHGAGPVPVALRSRGYRGAPKPAPGEEYRYPHDYPGGWVDQAYMPEAAGRPYYEPTDHGDEADVRRRMETRRGGAEGSE